MSTGANKPRMISAEEFAKGWDAERKPQDLQRLQVNLKGTTLCFPVRFKTDLDETYGGPVTHVKFRTFEDSFRVWITPCKPTDEDARPLSVTSETGRSAQLGFAIPLRKLNIKVPETRTYSFDVERIPVEGGGAVYEISFQGFDNQPRNVDVEALAAIKKAKAEMAKLKRAQARAARIARVTGAQNATSGATEP